MSEKPWQQTFYKKSCKAIAKPKIRGKRTRNFPRISEKKKDDKRAAIGSAPCRKSSTTTRRNLGAKRKGWKEDNVFASKASSHSFKENLRVKSGVTRLQGPRTRACLDSTTPCYTTRKHSTRRGHSSTHNGVYVAVSHQKERKMNANASTTVLGPAALAVGTQHSAGFAPAIAHKQESKRPE